MKRIIAFCLCLLLLSLSACQQEIMPEAPPEEWINPVESIDLNGMNLFWQHDNIQFSADESAKLYIYVAADKNENGEFAFDDGQEWLLLMETSLGNYQLFSRKYVQLGSVSCTVFNEYIDDDVVSHVLVTVQQTAGYQLYDCVFDDEKSAFKVMPIYDAMGINFITDSKTISSSE